MSMTPNQPLREETEPAEMADGGPPSPFTCPECGGALWESNGGPILQYRCHVGHAFSEQALEQEQGNDVTRALVSALRALEERVVLVRRLGETADALPD